MHSSLSLSVLAAAALWAPAASAQQLPNAPKETFVEVPGSLEFSGRMIARPIQVQDAAQYGITEAEAHARRASALEELSGFEHVAEYPEVDWVVIAVQEGSENQVATRLMATGDFEYVEPDWTVYPIGCPNDSGFGNQWHHNANRMNSCAAWDLETGDPSVVIGICDTGVRTTHQDLALRRVEGYNAVTHLWESQGGQINDINGHGTATTGCAAANGNNGIGIAGSGWTLSHRMMRVTNNSNGSASMTDLTHAARTSADAGDKVQSVSYSGVTSSSVNSTGAYCRSKGALLVWAAGNEGQNLSGNRNDNTVVVGATNSSDGKPSWSNYGSFVDFMAPGDGIYTTSNSCNTCYGAVSGTSFSCPLTAGLAGLLYSKNPSATPVDIENALRNGCDDLGASGVDNIYGYGRIDSFNSLSLIGGGGPELLFADGFESGNFTAGGWAIKGVKNSVIHAAAARTGNWGARLRKKGWCEKSINTTTYKDITVNMSWRARNYDTSGEDFTFEWWNGSAWTPVQSKTGGNTWTDDSFVLPAGANNNANLKIRFRSNGDRRKERGDLDDVSVFGTKI